MPNKSYSQRLKEKEAQEKKDKRLVVGGLTGVAAAFFLWQGVGQDQEAAPSSTPYEVSQGYSNVQASSAEISTEWQNIIDNISPYNFAPDDVPEELLANRDFVIAAISKNAQIVRFIPAKLKNDKGVMMAAAAKSPLGLSYASDELKSDKGMVLFAVAQNGMAIHYMDEKFLADKDVMRLAIADNGAYITYASKEIQADRELARAAIRSNVNAYFNIAEELKSDINFAREAVRGSGYAMLLVPRELGLNPDIYSLTTDTLMLSHFVNSLTPEEVSENPELLAYINYLDVLDAREGGFNSEDSVSLKYGTAHHAVAVLEEYKVQNPDWLEKAEAASTQAIELYEAAMQSQEAEAEGGYWTWKPFKGFYPKHWDTQPKP